MIDALSVRSIKIKLFSGSTELGSATAFITKKNDKFILVTNYHVLTGKNPFTGEYITKDKLMPDRIVLVLRHNMLEGMSWDDDTTIPLYDSGLELFKYLDSSNPDGTDKTFLDIAALPVSLDEGKYAIDDLDIDLLENKNINLYPTAEVAIVGFPFGLASAGSLPIWKSGQIACEPEAEYQGYPAILVDAATRQGMSGSPVYFLAKPPYEKKNGDKVIAGATAKYFIGIYSGRLVIPSHISSQMGSDTFRDLVSLGSDIGIVWTYEAIKLVLNQI